MARFKKNGENGDRKPNRAEKMFYLDRERRMRRMILEGLPRMEIRAVLGITCFQYERHRNRILKRWESDEAGASKRHLQHRVRQHEHAAHMCWQSFLRSQQKAETITTQIVTEKCPDCKGTKHNKKTDSYCVLCTGTGKVKTEHVTRKIVGQAGDSSFMKEFRENVKAAAALENLRIPKEVHHNVTGQIGHTHQSLISEDNRFKDAPPELILEMMSVMAKIEASKEEAAKGDIIDVKLIEEGDTK